MDQDAVPAEIVISKLTNQIQELALAVAMRDALIQVKDQEIAALRAARTDDTDPDAS